MSQPVIIEISYQNEGNSMSFSLKGSLEWLKEMEAFVNFNCASLVKLMTDDQKFLLQGRNEMISAYEAMQNHKSYEGDFVSLKMIPSAT